METIGNSSRPLRPASWMEVFEWISHANTAESLPLHIASDRTRTRNP